MIKIFYSRERRRDPKDNVDFTPQEEEEDQ